MSQNIKNLSITFSKCDCISIRANGEWADFYLDKWPTGPGFTLSIHSTFGNWAHGWSAPGKDWLAFIAGLDAHYLGKKFGVQDDWDEDVFNTKMKRQILQYRRDESISKETAKLAWDELKDAIERSGSHKDECLRLLYHESESGFYDDTEMFDCGDIPSRQWTAFYELFWPLFIQALQEKQEKPPLWGLPTDTTAVDGQCIHVGDVCKSGDYGTEFTVVFEENAIRKAYFKNYPKKEMNPLLILMPDSLNPLLKYTILKKYNAQ